MPALMKKKISQLADRFGSNRAQASEPGRFLRGCKVINVPFVGGFCEVPFFVPITFNGEPTHGEANIVNVNDLDRHIIHLGRFIRDRREELQAELDATLFHFDELADAQTAMKAREQTAYNLADVDECNLLTPRARLEWARDYFICSWMTRGGSGGARGEFNQGMSIRYKSTGGDSVVRFRSATEALTEWQKVMRLCTFNVMDALKFIEEVLERDIPETGVYADAPWPQDGDNYRHNIDQRKLANMLTAFKKARVCVRFGEHDLIRELYPEGVWTWHRLESKTQARTPKSEVLLTRNIP